MVMYSDFFPKECTRVLVQAAAAISRSSHLIVIGNGKKIESERGASAPPASPFLGSGNSWGMSMTLSPMITPQPSVQSTPQLPLLSLPAKAELPAMTLAAPVKLEVPPPPKKENVLWEGAGSTLPELFLHSPAFIIKTLDLVFQKSRDLKRRKPLMADELAVLEPLLPLIETVTRKCREWTRDAIDLDFMTDEQQLTRLLTGDKPWSLSITSPYAGLFVLAWRPMEAIVVRTYAVSTKGGPVPVPLASRPSRLHTILGDRRRSARFSSTSRATAPPFATPRWRRCWPRALAAWCTGRRRRQCRTPPSLSRSAGGKMQRAVKQRSSNASSFPASGSFTHTVLQTSA
jgi:hypothetical protein